MLVVPVWPLLLLAPAFAAREAEVAVVGAHLPGLDAAAAAAAAAALVAAIDAAAGTVPVPPAEVSARVRGREALVLEGTFLGPGREKLDEGRVLYERAALEDAVVPLEEAVAALEDGLLGSPDTTDLIGALLLLGQARFFLGDADAARAAFSRVASLDPARELDPIQYPPKIVSAYAEARAAVRQLSPGRLTIEAPEGTKVTLDGRAVEPGVHEVAPGRHAVLVLGADGGRAFEAVEVAAGGRATVSAADPLRSLGEGAEDPSGRAAEARRLYGALGRHGGTSLVLLAGATGGGQVGLQLYEPRTNTFSRLVQADAGDDPVGAMADLVPSLAGFVTADGTLRTDRVSAQVAPLDIGDNLILATILLDPKQERETVTVQQGPGWWVWAGVGVVAAAGVTGVAVGIATNGQDSGDGPGPAPSAGGTVVVPIP
jgi:hypothetical protein